MLAELMEEWWTDAPWVIERINLELNEKYKWFLNRVDMSWDKVYHFLRKHDEAYRIVTDEFISLWL